MRYWRFMIAVFPLIAQACVAGQEQPPQDTEKSEAAPIKSSFHIRYINGSNVYIDGGRDDGLTEGAHLVLKQDPTKPPDDPSNSAVAPGVVAKLTVVAVASTSAVCQVEAKGREILPGETVTLTDAEVEKVVEKDTLGNTRKYPMVISFSTGDPLDEEVRNAIPRPPLPEVNAMRGRIGFDMSTIREARPGRRVDQRVRDGLSRRLYAHVRLALELERLLARRAPNRLGLNRDLAGSDRPDLSD